MTHTERAAERFGLIENNQISGIENDHGRFDYESPTPEDIECIVLSDVKTGRTKIVFAEFPDHRQQPLENIKNYLEEL